MSSLTRTKSLLVLLGDIAALYASLNLALLIRYGVKEAPAALHYHLFPFSILFFLWIFIFYISDLYHIQELKTGPRILQRVATISAIAALLSVIPFYLFGSWFELTPKTNLLLFAVIFVLLDSGIRFAITRLFLARYARTRILILGNSPAIDDLIQHIRANPQLGYDIDSQKEKVDGKELEADIRDRAIEILIVAPHFLGDRKFVKNLYNLLSLNTEIISTTDFYERVMGKIPLEEISEEWFVETLCTRHTLYDTAKRILDILLSAVAGIILLPLMLLIALVIRLTSPGPTLYLHKRMGRKGQIFTLYKFRSMRSESRGPHWTTQNDLRVTPVGKILRRTHLDELPQLWNILRGELSFIGPRAENEELARLYSQLPHYEIRHLTPPGLTGWAQLNYKASASVEEAFEKLKYDIYYVKNRNFILDVLILLKTIRYLFIRHTP